MEVDAAARFSGNRGSYHIAKSHHEGTLLVGFANRCQCVGGLAGLGYRNDQVSAADQWVTVAEFCSLMDLCVKVCQILECVFTHETCMQGGAASEQDDAFDPDMGAGVATALRFLFWAILVVIAVLLLFAIGRAMNYLRVPLDQQIIKQPIE